MIPAELFAALAGIPRLPGARCVGLFAAFDPPELGEPPADVEYRHQVAMRLCAHCPALQRCRDWLQSLPPRQRPRGVVAGQRGVNGSAIRANAEITSDDG